jgi:hypothetical protein
MEQLTIFDTSKIDMSIEHFNHLIKKDNVPYDLVAVNKMYDYSAVIFDRDNESLHYVKSWRGYIQKDYPAPGASRSFGTNYYLVDQRFSKYESIELTNKKREYTTCPRYELDKYMGKGWFPER